MPTAAEWEDWCLETFFLNASVDGKIEAIEIDDLKIIDFSNSADIGGAHREFLSVLPVNLDAYLKGDLSPSFKNVGKASARSLGGSEARPNFVRVLLFFLWLQITASKDEDEGDIRRMATLALKRRSPQVLIGLHNMWIALARWLRENRDIALVLPDHGRENNVGITTRLAFPTKRDLDLLRRVREDGYSRVDLRSVTRRIAGDNSFDRTSPAFRRAFAVWRATALLDEEAARDLPFMSAWTRVLAEKDIGTTIVLSCDEFGEVEALKRFADGRVSTLQTDASFALECGKLGSKIAKNAKDGFIALERTGPASWIVVETAEADEYVISRDALQMFSDEARNKIERRGEIRYLSWFLCRVGFSSKRDAPPAREIVSLRFIEKVRVGARGTYLGRWPLTPRVAFPGNLQPSFVFEGKSFISAPAGHGVANFPEGVWNGIVQARVGALSTEVALRSDAFPHADEDIKFMSRGSHVPEDGPLHDSEPKKPDDIPVGKFERGIEPDPRLIALQEALYARSARTISLQSAVDMASRVSETDGAPDIWSLVRLFVDCGWFDVPSQSQVPARTLVQRRPSFRWRSDGRGCGVSIEGPLPLKLEELVRSKAEALGLIVERNLGRTEWSLPKLWIGSADAKGIQSFLESSDLREAQVIQGAPTSKDWSALQVGAEFERTGTWDLAQSRFGGDYEAESWPRLVRMDRVERDTFARYVVEQEDGLRETFVSANLALLRYLELQVRPTFVASDYAIRTIHPRARLPSNWARWLATAHLRNCALLKCDDGWACEYPATDISASILSKIYSGLSVKLNTSSTESGMLPWMERTRIRFARDRRSIWHDGKPRAIHDLDGLRTCLREPRETS